MEKQCRVLQKSHIKYIKENRHTQTVKDIFEHFNKKIAYETLRSHLVRNYPNDHKKRKKVALPQYKVDFIKENYLKMTYQEVADRIGCSRAAVVWYLQAEGLTKHVSKGKRAIKPNTSNARINVPIEKYVGFGW